MNYMKKLREQRDEKVAEMEGLLNGAKTEDRAMTAEETEKFDTLEKEIDSIDKTIAAEERARGIKEKTKTDPEPTQEEMEERAFVAYILNKEMELRAGEKNLTKTDNGAIIPTSIANKIIKEVKNLCPILKDATIYHMKGTLKIPVWGDNEGHNINVGFHDELTELTADAGKFTSIDLDGYLVGALTLIGRTVLNNASFNVADFIIRLMAEAIAEFMEGKLLNGASGKNEGALATTNKIVAASTSVITADELIETQAAVHQKYQKDACWTMHPTTFLAAKKLKDSNDRYLIQDDITKEFPHTMLGKPVHLSDNMPTIAAGADAILYGDYKGLTVKIGEEMSIDVLREQYATKHAVGVVAWVEFDSKVTDKQRLSKLQMAAASGTA